MPVSTPTHKYSSYIHMITLHGAMSELLHTDLHVLVKESSGTIIIELRQKNSAISEKPKNNKHICTCRYDTVPYTLTQSLFKALPPEKR